MSQEAILTPLAQQEPFPSNSGNVDSGAFSPDGALLAAGGDNNSFHLWEVSSGALLQTFTGHTDRVQSIAFAPAAAKLPPPRLTARCGCGVFL